MASQAVRALITAREPRLRESLMCAAKALRLASLVSLLVFIACGSVLSVAHGSADATASYAGLAACEGGSDALGEGGPAPLHYRQNDVLSVGEVEALGPEDSEEQTEEDAGALVGLARCVLPSSRLGDQAPRVTSVTYAPRFLVSSALPRGPPQHRR